MSALLDLDFWVFVGAVAGIFTIFALGLQLQFGFTGLLNFGHVAFMALAAYTAAILIVKASWPTWAACLAAIAVSVAFGFLLGLPTVRLRADYLAIVTIAASEIIRNLATNLSGLTGGPQGTINLQGPGVAATYYREWAGFQGWVRDRLEAVFGDIVSLNFSMMVIVWTVALLLLTVVWVLVRSPWGRVLRAVREDEDAAAALGKNVVWYKLQALGLGGALGAVAGLFFAFQFRVVNPNDFDPLTTFFAWVIVMLGGTARTWAVPVGAIIFGVLFAGTRFLDIGDLTSAELSFIRLIAVGLVLIGLMAFRPEGLFGKREEMVLE